MSVESMPPRVSIPKLRRARLHRAPFLSVEICALTPPPAPDYFSDETLATDLHLPTLFAGHMDVNGFRTQGLVIATWDEVGRMDLSVTWATRSPIQSRALLAEIIKSRLINP